MIPAKSDARHARGPNLASQASTLPQVMIAATKTEEYNTNSSPAPNRSNGVRIVLFIDQAGIIYFYLILVFNSLRRICYDVMKSGQFRSEAYALYGSRSAERQL